MRTSYLSALPVVLAAPVAIAAALGAAASCTPDKQATESKLFEPSDGTGGRGGEDASVGGGGGGGSEEDSGGPVVILPDAAEDGAPACRDCVDAAVVCGDGIRDTTEACDDGDLEPGDGCSADCLTVEQDYACPEPGKPCVSTVSCGDRKISGAETCDDGNTAPGDGCGIDCQPEPGWVCPTAGLRCRAERCGDGILAGNERCDDGLSTGGDGCDDLCRREPGWVCNTPGAPCRATVCGDGTQEGSEQCDDGARKPYDGCSPTCTVEPSCAGGKCSATCGDGLVFPDEACDDGNRDPGDGCSATCTIEAGFACQTQELAPPSELVIPILYRDFLYHNTTNPGPGHPDFERYGGSNPTLGMVQPDLGADGKPVFLALQGQLTSAESFFTWYHDTTLAGAPNGQGIPVFLDVAGAPTALRLVRQPSGQYQYASGAFFPVDGLGWNANPPGQVSVGHNFAFTSELHYPFTYQGGEVLDFTGDDDVWVFINGKLAVDLGGLHPPRNGGITLDATAATNLGLTVGGMYEIALFQAERHTEGSNYRLTLGGFTRAVTVCTSVCGDAVVTPDEVCDDGVNDGSYGGCKPGCLERGPSCGDGVVDSAHEACDDGVNLSPYGGCAPGCVTGGRCGDGEVDGRFGEQCDDGTNAGEYGGCKSDCKLAPRCGDGVTQPAEGEQCDDGNTSNRDECSTTCESRVPA